MYLLRNKLCIIPKTWIFRPQRAKAESYWGNKVSMFKETLSTNLSTPLSFITTPADLKAGSIILAMSIKEHPEYYLLLPPIKPTGMFLFQAAMFNLMPLDQLLPIVRPTSLKVILTTQATLITTRLSRILAVVDRNK